MDAVPTPPDGPRHGKTFIPRLDQRRLNGQAKAVFEAMHDGAWRSLAQIATLSRSPEASISARLRDFRKPEFGRHTVERERQENGLFIYRLIPNPDA